MNERTQNPDSRDDASEITITAPRFDASEARRASPVVPLAQVQTRADELTAHSAFRRRARRSWPLGVVIVSLLAVAAIGGIGSKVLRRDADSQTPKSAAQQVEATLHARDFSSTSREESHTNVAPGEGRARRNARPAQAGEIFVSREGEDFDDDDDEKDRERGRGKRKHRKDDDREDFEKILKDAKKHKKAVRVGVIVGN